MSTNMVTLESVPEGMRYKKASTSYFQYLYTRREKIRENNPDASDGEISKIAASEWNKFSQDEKKPYHELYLKEKSELQMNPQLVPIVKESMEKTKKRKIEEVSSVPEGMRYKKASTSYFQYLFTRRDKIREENPDASDGKISKIAASEWNNFSADEKKPYQELYLKEKSELEKNPQLVPIVKELTENTRKKMKIE